MIENSSLKTCISKKYLNIALSKICISKNIPKLLPQKMYSKIRVKLPLKIAPSKNAFQNCYKLSIENKNKKPC